MGGDTIRVGVWRKGGEISLQDALNNGWNLVLEESDDGKPVFGSGHMLHFKNPWEKLSVKDALGKLGFAPRGPKAYLVTGTPEKNLLRQLQEVFPTARFFNVNTGGEINL